MINSNEPFEMLARAIIIQAAKDYKVVLRILNKNPQHSKALREKEKLEDFFLSDYFKVLTKVNGEKLLSRLQEIAYLSESG